MFDVCLIPQSAYSCNVLLVCRCSTHFLHNHHCRQLFLRQLLHSVQAQLQLLQAHLCSFSCLFTHSRWLPSTSPSGRSRVKPLSSHQHMGVTSACCHQHHPKQLSYSSTFHTSFLCSSFFGSFFGSLLYKWPASSASEQSDVSVHCDISPHLHSSDCLHS